MSADVALVEVPYLELVHSLGSNFLFVGLGLLLGTAGLVDPDSSRGLVAFLQWVALPAILFRGMATMDKSSIQGLALAALVFSKALVVAGTGVLAVLFSRREDNKWKSAGICALFSALTNDVSFGLPIARVLFPAQAFYLFIPIQSLLFEPICLCLLEVRLPFLPLPSNVLCHSRAGRRICPTCARSRSRACEVSQSKS